MTTQRSLHTGPVRWCLLLLFSLAAVELRAEDLNIEAQLIWGTNAEKSPDASHKPVDKATADKLKNVWHAEIGSIKVLKNCISAVRRGGFVSVVGVYGIPYDAFPLGQIFDKGIRMAFGQALVQRYIDELISYLEEGRIKLDDIVTHRLPLSDAPRGYEIFSEKKDGCVKVVLKP